ncbi:hypothetical protein D3C76_1394860 [compost metagenome]
MLPDQSAQRVQRFQVLQTGAADNQIERALGVFLQSLSQVFPCSTVTVQGRLAHACQLRQLFHRRSWPADDRHGQRFEQVFITGNRVHHQASSDVHKGSNISQMRQY